MNPAIFGGRGCGGGCGPKKGPSEPSETIINIGGGDSSLGCIRDPDTCEITGKVLLIPAPAAIAFPGCPAPSPSEAKPSLFYIGTDGTCEPYDPEIHGEWGSCECNYNFLQIYVDQEDSPYCGLPIFACGDKWFVPFEGEITPLEDNMIKVTTTNAGNLEKACETLDIPIAITEPLSGNAADLIALALAEGLTFPTYGEPTEADVVAITGQSTGPVTYAGQVGDCIEDTEGVSATTEFDFPADCLPVNLNVCLRKCLTAAEVKALSGEG